MSRHGENIRKRPDGRWEVRIVCRSLPDGRKIVKSFYGNTYAEAKTRRTAFADRLHTDESGAPPLCFYPVFRGVASAWIAAKARTVKRSTLSIYQRELNIYLLPEFGDWTIDRLDGDCINDFLTNLLQNGRKGLTEETESTGLSAKTVANVKLVLLSILKYARKCHMIENVPECMTISSVIPKIEVLTKIERRALEEVLFSLDKPICLISILSLYTGIRIGEACGLQWRDVDLINGTISITKTVIRITNADSVQVGRTKVVIQSPKTQSSIRVIPIPDRIMSYLQKQKSSEHIYLASGKETYTEPRRCQYQFRQLLKQAEIPYYKFHVLRHTFATRCVEQGVDVKSLSEILGHSSVTITMQRYVHPSLEMKRAQINKLTQS